MQISILNGTLSEISETLSPTTGHGYPQNVTATGYGTYSYTPPDGKLTLGAPFQSAISVTAASYTLTCTLTGCTGEMAERQGLSGSYSQTIYANIGHYISTATITYVTGTATISADKKSVSISVPDVNNDFSITVNAPEVERKNIIMHPNNNGTEDPTKMLLPKATEAIIVNDIIRALYVNQNIGTDRLNAALAALSDFGTSHTDCYTQPLDLGGIFVPCKYSLLRGTVFANDTEDTAGSLISIIDIKKLGYAMSPQYFGYNCTGYLICYITKTGIPQPIYMSDWNGYNTALISAAADQGFVIEASRAGWYTDYIDLPVDYYYQYGQTLPTADPQYPAYVKVTSKNSDNVDGNVGSFDLFDELFTKTPSTFDGQFVTKDYVDSLIISALNTAI